MKTEAALLVRTGTQLLVLAEIDYSPALKPGQVLVEIAYSWRLRHPGDGMARRQG